MSNYSTDIETAELGENGLSKKAGWVTVYHVKPDTGEYLSASYEYLMMGVGLPAHSYPDEPELPPAGKALRRNITGQRWEHVPDYRGKTAYRTDTREASTITAFGELPDGLTLLAPTSEFDTWNGKKWVTDKAAQQAAATQATQQAAQEEFSARLSTANTRIQALNDAVELAMATEQETALLVAWKTYRVMLNRLNLDTAPAVDWPQAPQE